MPSRSASPARTSAKRVGAGAPLAEPLVHPRVDPLAEPLHRCALQLLRLVRAEDAASGLSAARLSALSVLVFGGPFTLGALARAEQVSGPTMTKLARGLEREGWLRRSPAPDDARASLLSATPKARRLLLDGKTRRLAALSRGFPSRGSQGYRALARALPALQRVVDALTDIASGATAQRSDASVARSGRRRFTRDGGT